MSASAAKKNTGSKNRQKTPYWRKRPTNSTTDVFEELKTRGIYPAYLLFRAKLALSVRRDKTMLKIGSMIGMGTPNEAVILSLYQQATEQGKYPDRPLGYAFGSWLMRAQEGIGIAGITAGWLPDDAKPLLESGEKSAKLRVAIEKYLFISKKRKEMTTAIRNGLMGPLSNVGLIIAYLWIIAYKMDPAFSRALPRSQWTGALYIVGMLSDLVKHDLIYALIIIVTIASSIYWSLDNLLGNARMKLENIPPWSIYRQFYGTSFMLSFASLYRAATKDSDILAILLKNANKYYAEKLRDIQKHVKRGEKIGDALAKSKYVFPEKELISDLQIYQNLPNLAEIVENAAIDFTETNIKNVKAATGSIGLVMLVLSYSMILLISVSVFTFVNLAQKKLGN